MKYIIIICTAIILLAGCKKTDTPTELSNDKEFGSFIILNGVDSIKCLITDSTVVGVKRDTSGKASMIAMFTFRGAKVTLNGTEQVSGKSANDFRMPLTYTVTAEDGSSRTYTVKLKNFTGLPILYITSPPISSKEQYVDGSMTIDGNMDYPSATMKIQIRGRGNSTWGKPKNPYKIKLADKAGVLGMPADKEWALLANWYDKSLLRNDLAFELSEIMQMTWTPRRRLVEVYMNGAYHGNYLLTETVKSGKDRLNINVINDKDPADTLNGFLIEADWQQLALQTFVTPNIVKFSIKEPEVVTNSQYKYITNQFVNIENQAFGKDNNLSAFIDIDSWVKWTIVNEVMRNRDGILYGSVFFYQGAAQKIFMGPVWDFDLSAGSYPENTSTGWYVTTSKFVGTAFMSNAPYREKFKTIWNKYKPTIALLPSYLVKQKKIIQLSQLENFKRWPIMSTTLFDGQISYPTYDEEIEHLNSFLKERIDWMDKELNR